MHAAPCASVSELYSADEVALLLEEIRDLEPTNCRGEDVQDCEIAGSGLAGGGGGAGGRSPCGTELTERSWDSHAQYSRAPPLRARKVAPLYCRLRHLASAGGAASLLLALCALAACACVWALAGVRTQRLPLAGRVRALLLGALTSALLHAALVFAHVTRLAALLPVDWRALRLAAAAWALPALAAPAAAVAHAVLAAPDYRHAPPRVRALLLAAAALAAAAAALALLAAALAARACLRRRRRAPSAPRPAARAAYRAVPAAPPPPPPASAPQPSTSRDHAL